MSEVSDAIDNALHSEDKRFSSGGFNAPKRAAHSRKYLSRILRRLLENIDGQVTVAEVLDQLDEVTE